MQGDGFVDPAPILEEEYQESVVPLNRRFAKRKGRLWHLVYVVQR
jgi:hypothetical protein